MAITSKAAAWKYQFQRNIHPPALEFNPLVSILHPTSRLDWPKVVGPRGKNKGMSLNFSALADEGEVCISVPSKVQGGKTMRDWRHWNCLKNTLILQHLVERIWNISPYLGTTLDKEENQLKWLLIKLRELQQALNAPLTERVTNSGNVYNRYFIGIL